MHQRRLSGSTVGHIAPAQPAWRRRERYLLSMIKASVCSVAYRDIGAGENGDVVSAHNAPGATESPDARTHSPPQDKTG